MGSEGSTCNRIAYDQASCIYAFVLLRDLQAFRCPRSTALRPLPSIRNRKPCLPDNNSHRAPYLPLGLAQSLAGMFFPSWSLPRPLLVLVSCRIPSYLDKLCRACTLLVNNSVEIVICLFSQSNVRKGYISPCQSPS